MNEKRNQLFNILALLCLALSLPTSAWGQFTFTSPAVVDYSDGAFEPKIITDPSDHIFIAAPFGSPGPSAIWRSTNGGATFAKVGPGIVNTPPSTGITVGGGDCDLASDAAGNLYFIDLWLGDASAAVSTDGGNTWASSPISNPPVEDRPWISADPRSDHLGTPFLITHVVGPGLFFSESEAGPLDGLVYPITILEITDQARGAGASRGQLGYSLPAANLVTNQKGDTYNLYSVGYGYFGAGLAVGQLASGSTTPVNRFVSPSYYDNSLPTDGKIAVDTGINDNLYVVWTNQVNANEWDIRFTSSSNGGSTWIDGGIIGHGVYPWIAARAPGKVDIAWYTAQFSTGYIGDPNIASNSTQWDVAFAQSSNALSSSPMFTSPVVAASQAKLGSICTGGGNCAANRELGDFMSVTSDSQGNALISYVHVPRAGSSVVMFTKQTAGTVIK